MDRTENPLVTPRPVHTWISPDVSAAGLLSTVKAHTLGVVLALLRPRLLEEHKHT